MACGDEGIDFDPDSDFDPDKPNEASSFQHRPSVQAPAGQF